MSVLLLAGAPLQALAQAPRPAGDLTDLTLEELMNIPITTASRTAEGLAGAPARVEVVTGAQIARRGYRSVSELLKDLPDFKLDFAGEPDFPVEITVQGTRGAGRVVLLLDGIRVSSPTNEPLPFLANYPVHNARQVEIVYGPASALYGADAFSAVINIIAFATLENAFDRRYPGSTSAPTRIPKSSLDRLRIHAGSASASTCVSGRVAMPAATAALVLA